MMSRDPNRTADTNKLDQKQVFKFKKIKLPMLVTIGQGHLLPNCVFVSYLEAPGEHEDEPRRVLTGWPMAFGGHLQEPTDCNFN